MLAVGGVTAGSLAFVARQSERNDEEIVRLVAPRGQEVRSWASCS